MKLYNVAYPDDRDVLFVVAESKEAALDLFNKRLYDYAELARLERPWFKTPVVLFEDIFETDFNEVVWFEEGY